ncbi:hypothetical protein [Micromonospora halophytica]|uniref:Uncharacterized protein n=1 Tax=Micromonospora halophytica TaxID=47864 RepID=A0A1C5ISC3_9ACTN|nr:hypothetical protein [Micromonospora halophytica]SCG61277.1 hypothetical protein GA0070560_11616 [Micromonospora halophytica]
MSLRSLLRTRRHPRPATRYVDRHVIGTPEELGVLMELATERGLLVFASVPVPLPDDPTRFRRHLRLRTP